MRLRRSELAVPAANERFVQKSAESDADLVFLDLEDATAPDKKVAARQIAVDALNQLDWGNKIRAVRVNDHATQWAVHDVISIVEGAGENLDILILPKVKQPRDVWFFETMLDSLEQALGLQRKIGFEALIEEAEALANVEALATSSSRLEALILGFGDLAGSMGMRFGHELDDDFRYRGATCGTRTACACSPPAVPPGSMRSTALSATSRTRSATRPRRLGPLVWAPSASGAFTRVRSSWPTTSLRRRPRRSSAHSRWSTPTTSRSKKVTVPAGRAVSSSTQRHSDSSSRFSTAPS